MRAADSRLSFAEVATSNETFAVFSGLPYQIRARHKNINGRSKPCEIYENATNEMAKSLNKLVLAVIHLVYLKSITVV